MHSQTFAHCGEVRVEQDSEGCIELYFFLIVAKISDFQVCMIVCLKQ